MLHVAQDDWAARENAEGTSAEREQPAPPTVSYEAGLSTRRIDAALGELVACERRCEWLLCRYLADLADGDRYREIGWYSDLYHYAYARFRLHEKSTRERVRIGRALRELPHIERAFVTRALG